MQEESKKSLVAEAQENFHPILLETSLDQARDLVHAVNVEKGWHDQNPRLLEFEDALLEMGINVHNVEAVMNVAARIFGPRTFGDDIALLQSEASEMLEEFRRMGTDRFYEDDNGNKVVLKPDEIYPFGRKPLGVPSEAADVLVRLLDTCKRWEINLGREFAAKVAYNITRPYRHGGKAL